VKPGKGTLPDNCTLDLYTEMHNFKLIMLAQRRRECLSFAFFAWIGFQFEGYAFIFATRNLDVLLDYVHLCKEVHKGALVEDSS
jgi:hypothetical protein